MSIKVERPKNLLELWDILDQDDVRVVAGGTDLMVRVRAKVEKPKIMVDITGIPELKIFESQNDKIIIGATLTHSELLRHEIPQLLHDAISTIGSPQIRNMGTIGGNICNASPAGDAILPLYVYDAELTILSRNGERTIPIKEFIKGPGKTSLEKGEILSKITIPTIYNDYGHLFKKVGKRVAMTISIVSMGLIFKIEDGIIKDIKIAYGAVAPRVLRMMDVEAYLIGKKIEDRVLNEAQKMIFERVSPISDIRATGDYRREVAGNLILLLKEAYGKL